MTMADKISTLPDEVLCRILSFLPTKAAVATSVLSRRWHELWLSVPSLDFDDEHAEDERAHFRFNQFVYAVMLSRKVTQPIKKLRLMCRSSLSDLSNINRWVNAAIERGVEHLDLFLGPEVEWFYLPRGILSCRTLVVLKLNGFTLNSLSSIELPLLKVLHLDEFYFSERRYLKELLSGCPILEELRATYLDFTISSIEGEFTTLPKLVRADIYSFDISDFDVPLKVISNVEFLRIEEMDNSHKVVNPKDIPMFHNLTRMELIFVVYANWHWVVEMLKHCPMLQILDLEKRKTHRATEAEVWPYPQFVPECLTSQLRICSLRDYGGEECELLFAKYIMQNSRVLRTMTVCSTHSSNPKEQLQILKELSMCSRKSVTCELIFE